MMASAIAVPWHDGSASVVAPARATNGIGQKPEWRSRFRRRLSDHRRWMPDIFLVNPASAAVASPDCSPEPAGRRLFASE